MRIIRTVLALSLLAGAASFTACETTAACSADSCSGCCDGDGRCQSGTEQLACGQGGFQCTSCSIAQQCRLGGCSIGSVGTGGGSSTGGGSGGGASTGGGSGGGSSTGGGSGGGGGSCTAQTCAQAGAECGSASDGCGGTLSCGTCSMGRQCGGGGVANVCGTGACTPVTCSQQGKNCGSISDGCSATLNCGTCSGSQTCGAGGVANVCGTGACTPTTCAAAGAACGAVPDGCGGSLSCGTCSGPQTCGGGGVANQCGASCLLSCPGGYSCDAQGDCVNGTQSNVVLNVTDPLKVAVAGTVTLNGGIPATGYCSSSYSRATVKFVHATNNHYDTTVTIVTVRPRASGRT